MGNQEKVNHSCLFFLKALKLFTTNCSLGLPWTCNFKTEREKSRYISSDRFEFLQSSQGVLNTFEFISSHHHSRVLAQWSMVQGSRLDIEGFFSSSPPPFPSKKVCFQQRRFFDSLVKKKKKTSRTRGSLTIFFKPSHNTDAKVYKTLYRLPIPQSVPYHSNLKRPFFSRRCSLNKSGPK